MNDLHRRARRITAVFFIAGLLWVFVTEKLLEGLNPVISDVYLHDWLIILFAPLLFYGLLEFFIYKLGKESSGRLKAEVALRETEERFRFAMRGANDGLWDWDLATDQVYYSPRLCAMLGFAEGELKGNLDTYKELAHPEDIEPPLALARDLIEGKADRYEIEYRLRHKDGHYVDILSRGYLVRSPDGKPLRIVGTLVDISELKRTQNFYQSLLNNMHEGCVYCRMIYADGRPVDFEYLEVNESFRRITSLTNVVGKRVSEVFPALMNSEPNLLEIAGRVVATGTPEIFESYIPELDVWLSNSIYSPQKGHFIGVFDDITERKRAEAALRDSEQRVRVKLDAILSPEGDISSLNVTDVLDIPAIQSLLEQFYKLTGVPVCIDDVNGKPVASVGWAQVCEAFHRACPAARMKCRESDIEFCSNLQRGEYRIYKCKNNMIDVAMPIMIGDQQVGNLMSGQFFFEGDDIDEALFRAQARTYGFDEEAYMAALARVPRVRRDKIEKAMAFLMELANMISELSYNRIKLARALSERIALMDSLREREEIYGAIVNQADDGIALVDIETLRFVEFNEATCRAFGYTREEFSAITLTDLMVNETPAQVAKRVREIAQAGGANFVGMRLHKSGRRLDMNISARVIHERGRDYLSIMWRDETEHRRAEEALRLSEQRFRDVSEAAGEFIWETDTSGVFTYLSDRVETVLGYRPEELLGRRSFNFLNDPECARDEAPLRLMHGTHCGFRNYEHCIVSKSGQLVWLSATAVPMSDPDGNVSGYRGATLNITERKNHEREIERLNRLYATLSQLNKTVTHVHTREELFQEVCRISAEHAGFQVVWIGRLDESTGHVVQVASAGSRAAYLERVGVQINDHAYDQSPTAQCILEDRPTIINDFSEISGGEPWHAAAAAFGLQAAAALPIQLDNQTRGVFAVYADEPNIFRDKEVALLKEAVSDIGFALQNIAHDEMRRDALTALSQSEARFRSYIEHSPMAIFVVDQLGRYVDSNPAVQAFLGYDVSELSAMTIADVLNPEDRARGLRDFALLQECGDMEREYGALRKDGSVIQVHVRTVRVSPENFMGFAIDVTDRAKSEQALRDSEGRYRGLFENSLDGILMTGHHGRVIAANPAACELFGMTESEICETRLDDLIDSAEPNMEKRDSFGRATHEQICIRKGGARFPAETTSVCLDCGAWSFMMIHDISNRKKAEEERQALQAQLLQSQKMEAIGQLAGGIAHDFNNLLTVILGYGEMLLAKLPDDDPNKSYVADIHESGERAAALTRQLLAFSRKQILAPKVLNVNGIIDNLEKMLRRLIGEDVILTTELSANVSPVEVDPSQLEQVVINLVVNARDAMPDGGRLFIETGNCELDGNYCHLHPGSKPGHYVLITITDSGCGMTEEVRSKIFEPFFTTKEQGRGTGLGLATVFGIIKQSGGNIEVVSEPGVGTCFKIYLPALTDNLAGNRDDHEDGNIPSGSESILLVEDEEGVRRIARIALETHGYKVIEADCGPAAIEISDRPGTPVDMLVTDVVMPEMSGRELAEKMRALRPELKVLFISGYTDDTIFRHEPLNANTSYLQKPFAPVTLARRVRQLLDAEH